MPHPCLPNAHMHVLFFWPLGGSLREGNVHIKVQPWTSAKASKSTKLRKLKVEILWSETTDSKINSLVCLLIPLMTYMSTFKLVKNTNQILQASNTGINWRWGSLGDPRWYYFRVPLKPDFICMHSVDSMPNAVPSPWSSRSHTICMIEGNVPTANNWLWRSWIMKVDPAVPLCLSA